MQQPAKGSILALDVGSKRIGVAIASHAAKLPAPLITIDNDRNTFNTLQKLVTQHTVTDVVIGLPRNLNGNDTAQTAFSRAFAQQLQNLLTGQKVHLFDEAGTSILAEEKLKSQKKHYTKADIDKFAASYILQSYLEAQ